jgi:hypothetical protein
MVSACDWVECTYAWKSAKLVCDVTKATATVRLALALSVPFVSFRSHRKDTECIPSHCSSDTKLHTHLSASNVQRNCVVRTRFDERTV